MTKINDINRVMALFASHWEYYSKEYEEKLIDSIRSTQEGRISNVYLDFPFSYASRCTKEIEKFIMADINFNGLFVKIVTTPERVGHVLPYFTEIQVTNY